MSDDIVVPRLTAPEGGGNRQPLREIATLFLRIGVTAFGGPAAHVTVIESHVVTQRPWLTRAAFLDLLGVVQVLPGPNSTELAIHIGHARAGWRGGVIAGLCFVLPSVVMVWMLASVAAAPILQPVVTTALWFLAPVVVAVLLEAQWKFGTQAWERPGAPVIMIATVVAALLLPSDLAVLAVGAVAALLWRGGAGRGGTAAALCAVVLLSVVGGDVVAQSSRCSRCSPVGYRRRLCCLALSLPDF